MSSCQAATSQSRTLPSELALARFLPLGANATARDAVGVSFESSQGSAGGGVPDSDVFCRLQVAGGQSAAIGESARAATVPVPPGQAIFN